MKYQEPTIPLTKKNLKIVNLVYCVHDFRFQIVKNIFQEIPGQETMLWKMDIYSGFKNKNQENLVKKSLN